MDYKKELDKTMKELEEKTRNLQNKFPGAASTWGYAGTTTTTTTSPINPPQTGTTPGYYPPPSSPFVVPPVPDITRECGCGWNTYEENTDKAEIEFEKHVQLNHPEIVEMRELNFVIQDLATRLDQLIEVMERVTTSNRSA